MGGTPPYSYTWSNGATTALITQLCAGTYVCTITDSHGCSKTKVFVILQPPPLLLSASPGPGPGTATAVGTGGTPPYTYKWFTSPVQTTATATGLIGGTVYQVKVIDFNACTATILFTMPLNRMDMQAGRGASVFPNPASDVLHIQINGDPAGCNITMINALGDVVWDQHVSKREEEIDVSSFAGGIYLVRVTGPGWSTAKKIMLQTGQR
jgi:hypothetical protein